MPHILILEGNTPALALSAEKSMGKTAAKSFGDRLKAIAPDLTVTVAAPYFEGFDPAAHDLSAYDGMVVTSSDVDWSGADEGARPFWDMYERAFAAGTPCFGSCWGMQTAAVALGGETKAGPNGVEAGFARALKPVGDHQMMAGRRAAFDAICMHRDDVTRAPDGATVTATNDHTAIQAFAYDAGGVSFWGVQYHPECDLGHVVHWFSHASGAWAEARRAEAKITARVAADPPPNALLAAKMGIGVDILDRAYHATELRNWLRDRVGAVVREDG